VHKEELIKLHQVMSEIKDSFERTNSENSFSEYYSQFLSLVRRLPNQ